MVIRQFGSFARRVAATGVAFAMTAAGLTALPTTALAQQTAGTATSAGAATDAATSTGSAAGGAKDVIVIAFQTNWNSVANECTEVYGPEGVGYVQISPPLETVQGTEWWTSYQPVSYKFDSKLGTEAELKNMIKVCNAAGVQVIADAVINHTTGVDRGEGTGVAGSKFDSNGDFPEIPYTKENFHDCDKNIGDYTNADEVQNCRLTGLQDLDTSQEYVQDKLADYMNRLLQLGVYGFRVDAVKHIANKDVAAIKAKLAEKSGRNADDIFFEQEVIGNASEAAAIQPSNYVGNGKVSEFNYNAHLSAAFASDITSDSKGLGKIGGDGWLTSDQAAVWVTNWDTERNSSAITYKKGSKYLLANAFMLAYDYGQPHVYSGYYFDDNDDGAPGATETSVPDMTCPTDGSMTSGTWQCADRWTAIRGMIGFHNAVAGTAVTDWKAYGSNVLGFGRGDVGYLALNNSDKDSQQTFTTSLPAGEYCNVYATGDCSQTVTVKDDGTFDATLGKNSAIAIYAGATKDSWTGTAKSDPSDPDLTVNDEAAKAATDTSRTIYYKLPDGWKQAYLHYGVNNWAEQGHELMTDAGNGWVKYTVDPKGQSFEYVFTDGGSNWDNPNGGGNYTAQGHWTAVADHEASAGVPSDVQQYRPKTKVVVHYKAAEGDAVADRGVYMWGTDKDGNALAAGWHAFTGEDSYGKVFETTVDGAYEADKIGVIVTTEGWDKVGGDRLIDGSTGTAEIWVDGSKPDETLTAAPEGYKKTADTINVTIHYHRLADDYTSEDGMKAWDIWGWADGVNGAAYPFTSHDDYGLTAKYTLKGSGMQVPQFIVRYGGDGWESKDPNDDNRTIPQSAITLKDDGTADAEIWLVQGDPTIYTNGTLYNAAGTIVSASMADFTTINVKLNKSIATDDLAGKVSIDGAEIKDVKADGNTLVITTKDELDVTKAYVVSVDGYGTQNVALGAVVRSDAFDKKYAYDGDDLGANYTAERTTFKLWAPTATKVTLRLYQDSTKADGAQTDAVTLDKSGDKGVWAFDVKGDLKDYAYDYELTFADGTVNTSPDPYATAAVVNGERSVVLSGKEQGDAGRRMASFSKPTDAIVTEANVRDMTINPNSGVSADKRGKYLGFVEEGTTVDGKKGASATGIDYLKSLGVTHVQIMPVYDYGSVDETGDLSYGADGAQNWGYDPVNYNVPEGSYSSDPSDPAARVTEMKQMVKGLHKNGLYVVMDVVYNHVYNASTHAFGKTVPGYYFRYDANGNLTNGSGCGNDVASERAMARKYIVDSVTYWAKEYNVDGFRFDLMGLIDQTTMKEVRAALDKIDPGILVIGEGWDMTDAIGDQETTQPNASKVPGVAFFNDSLRDAIKGSVFSDEDTGFVTGKAGKENLIATNVLGCNNKRDGIDDTGHCNNGSADTDYAGADQVVQYVEIHDNLTLYDKLVKSAAGDSEETRAARAKLADSLILLSQGVTDMQFGQEFLRTKGGNGNSYNAGDKVNAIDWNRAVEQADSVDYVRGLIALRKSIANLHLSDYDEIAKHMTVLRQSDGVVAYQLTDGDDTYVVAFNANDSVAAVTGVPAGSYVTLVADGKVTTDGGATVTVGEDGVANVGALAATVLKKAAAVDPDPTPTPDPDPTPDPTPTPGDKDDTGKDDTDKPSVTMVPVYRLYNPYSGLHHYTISAKEKNVLVKRGWKYEGVAFRQPSKGTPVYRAYNPYNGNHHWTANKHEYQVITTRHGWKAEGIAWYQDDAGDVTVYRAYNPYNGEHLYTADKHEYDVITAAKRGWQGEGIAWHSW
ncbi:type I pullulanase [Bifidobacterium amazonense]|uniref:Alpha-amylase n=1 Tax=Bifidobacterium amazonense TaxID=2809027 RepID=A0ABS9VYE8_9BIFI|nr:type I pullulanase [Bifidobacterium amazonense]MCH9277140.1 type I pullulanase [Bifidobacterium amazonense]